MIDVDVTSPKTGLTHSIQFDQDEVPPEVIQAAAEQADAPVLQELQSHSENPTNPLSQEAFKAQLIQGMNKSGWEKAKEYGQGFVEGVKGLVGTVKGAAQGAAETVTGIPSPEKIGKTVGDMIVGGITKGVEGVKEAIPEPRTKLQRAGDVGQSLIEGAMRGSYDLVNLAHKIWNSSKISPEYWSSLAPEEQQKLFDEMYQKYLSNEAWDQVRAKAATGEQNITPEAVKIGESNPKLAEGASLVLDPVTLSTLGAGAAAELPLKAISKGILGKAIVPSAKLMELGGRGLQKVAELPSAITGKIAGTVFKNPEVAGKVTDFLKKNTLRAGGAELLGLHVPLVGQASKVVAGAKGVGKLAELGGEGIKTAATKLMEDPTQIGPFRQIAQDTTKKPWIRNAATLISSFGGDAALPVVKSAIKSTATATGVGATLGALASDNPEQAGQGAGSGFGIGLALTPVHYLTTSKLRRAQAEDGSIAQWLKKQTDSGTPVEILGKLDRDTALQAATLSEMFGNEVGTRFVNKETAQKIFQNPKAAAMYTGGEIVVNADAPNINANFLHEFGHALADLKGRDADIKQGIDEVLGPEKVQQFRTAYADALIPEGEMTPEERSNRLDQTLKQLDQARGTDWAYGEIFAENFLDTFFGRNIRQTLDKPSETARAINGTPVDAKKLSFMATMLQKMGVAIDPKGTGEVVNQAKLISNIGDPKLREMVLNYSKEWDSYVNPSKEFEATDGAKEILTKQDALNNDPRLKNSIYVQRDPDGNPIGIRTKKEVDKILGKEDEDGAPGVRGNYVLNWMKDYITEDGEAGVTQSGAKLPVGLADDMLRDGIISKDDWDNIKSIELAIANRKNIQGHYQPAYLNRGNMAVDFKDITPQAITITKRGNIFVGGVDVLAAEKKILRTYAKVKSIQDAWENVNAYRDDAFRYMENLNSDAPVPSKNLFGERKAKLLNALFKVNDVAHPNDASALVNTSKSKRNPDQLWKSYRLDRWNTMAPSDRRAFNLNYPLARDMFRPDLATGQDVPRGTSETGSFDIANFIKTNPNGFTIDPFTGEFANTGYAVAPSKKTEFIIHPDELTEKKMDDYFEKHREILEGGKFGPGNKAFLGGWLNPETGNFVLDISNVVDNLHDALHIARNGEQDAIFHLDTGTAIPTDEGIASLKQANLWSDEAGGKMAGVQGENDQNLAAKGNPEELKSESASQFRPASAASSPSASSSPAITARVPLAPIPKPRDDQDKENPLRGARMRSSAPLAARR